MSTIPDVTNLRNELVAMIQRTAASFVSGTSYTFVAADALREVDAGSASATTFTVPPNSSVAFPIGTVLTAVQFGAGQLTIAAGVGVSVHRPVGKTLSAAAQFSTLYLRKRDTDDWVLSGDLA